MSEVFDFWSQVQGDWNYSDYEYDSAIDDDDRDAEPDWDAYDGHALDLEGHYQDHLDYLEGLKFAHSDCE